VDFSIADPGDGSAGIRAILAPKWQSLKGRLRRERSGSGVRLLLLVLLGTAVVRAIRQRRRFQYSSMEWRIISGESTFSRRFSSGSR